MPAKHSRHVALTAPLAAWIDAQVAEGHYSSASDVIRAALRLLKAQEGHSVVAIPAEPIVIPLPAMDDGPPADIEGVPLT